jgi:hypothetical protein
MTTKPPWIASSERERERMIDWVERQLDRFPEDYPVYVPSEEHDAQIAAWYAADGPEKIAAERGDMEPLRKKHPELARYLHPPIRKVGERRHSELPGEAKARFAVAIGTRSIPFG